MREERAAAMARRLHRAALTTGLARTDADLIVRCFEHAMKRRAAVIPDPQHPDYLHPARTALILMEDTGMTHAGAIAAAILYDSELAGLAMSAAEIEAVAGAGASAVATELPQPTMDDTELTEALVVAGAHTRDAAIAERLDHARHLHMGPRERWLPFHERIMDVYLPLCARAHPMLGRRLHRWAEAFQWRFLDAPVQRRT
jgi:hypothetical protein